MPTPSMTVNYMLKRNWPKDSTDVRVLVWGGLDLAWEHTVVSVITWLASVALISIWSALVGE